MTNAKRLVLVLPRTTTPIMSRRFSPDVTLQKLQVSNDDHHLLGIICTAARPFRRGFYKVLSKLVPSSHNNVWIHAPF